MSFTGGRSAASDQAGETMRRAPRASAGPLKSTGKVTTSMVISRQIEPPHHLARGSAVVGRETRQHAALLAPNDISWRCAAAAVRLLDAPVNMSGVPCRWSSTVVAHQGITCSQPVWSVAHDSVSLIVQSGAPFLDRTAVRSTSSVS